MPLRTFRDAIGQDWQVWETHPVIESASTTAFGQFMANQRSLSGTGQPVTVREEYVNGWLTFTNGSDKRRLVPIPSDWQATDDDQLRQYLDRAVNSPAPRRPTA